MDYWDSAELLLISGKQLHLALQLGNKPGSHLSIFSNINFAGLGIRSLGRVFFLGKQRVTVCQFPGMIQKMRLFKLFKKVSLPDG